MTAEKLRLIEDRDKRRDWRKFGPYLTERQWGTVREDYSADGNAWAFISHDMARSKAYRWGEEGIGGISDNNQIVCFSWAFWNKKDPILKERLFGLTGQEGNHGEDCKEQYYYLDSTPTHSYMKMLYKYPQSEFPYAQLVAENKKRGRLEPEYELVDTGIFKDNKYFDIFIEYAKAEENDILIRIQIHNRGDQPASVNVLPQVWFRNTWDWGYDDYKGEIYRDSETDYCIRHKDLGSYYLLFEGSPETLFCENETNTKKLFHLDRPGAFSKDGINDYIVEEEKEAIKKTKGTKAAINYDLTLKGNSSTTLRLRLTPHFSHEPFVHFDSIFQQRKKEADEFYADIQREIEDTDLCNIQRQAMAGMFWSKQFYYYNVSQWLRGDPGQSPPPKERRRGRNHGWTHLHNADIISMPDKWEYPWYASWDLAFHTIPLAVFDPEFAKKQLKLLTKEWYLHPSGQLPAFEWDFGNVNPPVHGWATWRVYKIDEKIQNGNSDRKFLEEVFHKLLLNFTWWVNKKDENGNNVFEGGFLGMDNIGVFDRNAQLPNGAHIEQSDATSWMAMFTLNMLRMSLELAKENPTYQSLATKFFEHFLYIAGAMANVNKEGIELWDDDDEFFYDVVHNTEHQRTKMKVRSMVGLIPLFAVEVLEEETFHLMPEFTAQLEWFLNNRPELANLISRWGEKGKNQRHLLSLLRGHRMKRILKRMLDSTEFLSEFGIRSLSQQHSVPYTFRLDSQSFSVKYAPAEAETSMFGGNSNWRGPIWFPVNYLIIESLQRFHYYYGNDFKVEHPTGSGQMLTLKEIADDLSQRLISIFKRNIKGYRPSEGDCEKLQTDEHFRDYITFYEFFHGDNGRGLGATHQTGWTGLVAKLIQPKGK